MSTYMIFHLIVTAVAAPVCATALRVAPPSPVLRLRYALWVVILSVLFLGVAGFSWLEVRRSAWIDTHVAVSDSAESLPRDIGNQTVMVGRAGNAQSGAETAATIDYDADGTAVSYATDGLELLFADGTAVGLPEPVFEEANWQRAVLNDGQLATLASKEPIVVYGEVYEAGSGDNLLVTASVVYRGTYEQFSAEYLPPLRRTRSYAQIVNTLSLVSVGVMLLTPLARTVIHRKSG